MHVEPNILFTVHEGAPFRRWCCLRSQPTPKGAPFYNAISTVMDFYSHGLFRCKVLQMKHSPTMWAATAMMVVALLSCSRHPHPTAYPFEVKEVSGPTFTVRISAFPEADGG